MDELLAELTRRCGIECEYTDAHGEQRRVPPDTQRALLQALGVDANSEAAIRSALDVEERKRWARALPPAVVFREAHSEPAIEIVVPQDLLACRWHLEAEDGKRSSGEVTFKDLKLIDKKDIDGIPMQRRRLLLPGGLPHGYYSFRIDCAASTCRVIVCPARCWLPQPGERRLWGVAAQLYLIRSPHNWGIGDFADLRDLMRGAAERGMDIVGVNPLHALFLDEPEHASPYSPTSRTLLNVLYLDVTSIAGYRDLPSVRALVEGQQFQQQLSSSQAADLVQYSQIAQLKLPVLRLLFAHAAQDRSSAEWRDFEVFCREQGEPLRLGSLFQVLREHFARLDRSRVAWRQWPREFQNPASTTVAAFAAAQADEVSFHQWLHWQADRQLGRASAAGEGMKVGLYRDLAVATDPAGAECWSNQALTLATVHVGAPPDLFQEKGQDWGLAPYDPRGLRDGGYDAFIALLRANMRHAGALRLDHAMALERLFWIPEGAPPSDGAYVKYPVQDLLGIVALESHRHRCAVVGEDLGTVRPEFRELMRDAGILSYRVLTFERAEDGSFLPADAYPALALAVAGNHDLATLRGWWEEQTEEEREKLLQLIGAGGCTAAGSSGTAGTAASGAERLAETNASLARASARSLRVEEVIASVHAFLRKTPCLFAMAQLDDLACEADPVNRPGTTQEYPSWRRRLTGDVDSMLDRAR
jgi:4-alpha-glucanotransferase